MSERKRTSKEWYEEVPKEYQLVIMNPGGWDRSNYNYSFNEELITHSEFMQRVFSSTVSCRTSFYQ